MKVIIADDHPVVRQGLRQMLAVESDLTVVGEARNGQEVVDLSRRVPWEVAVLDYNMPGKNGLELIKELRQRYPGRAVLILSMYPEDRYAVRALKAGASGYLTKESAPEELVSAIRKVPMNRMGEVTTLVLPQASLRGGSGDTLLSLSRVSLTTAGSGQPSSRRAVTGVGVARIRARVSSVSPSLERSCRRLLRSSVSWYLSLKSRINSVVESMVL